MQSDEKNAWWIMLNHKNTVLYIFNKISTHLAMNKEWGWFPLLIIDTPKYEGLEYQGRHSGSGTKSGECLNCSWAECAKKTIQLTVVKRLPEDLNFTQFLQKWAQVEIPRLGRRSKCWCCHVAPSNLWNWSYNQEPLKSGRNVVHKAASDESRLSSKNWYISMSQIGPLRNFHLTEWLLYNRSWKNSNY